MKMSKKEKNFIEKMPSSSSVDKVLKRVSIIILIIGVFALLVFAVSMTNALAPYDRSNHETITFKVEAGWGSSKVVDELAEKKLIKSPFLVKLYLKIKPQNNIKEGTYELNQSMTVDSIFKKISSNESAENETINIRFIEGKRFTEYMNQVATTLGVTYDEVMAKTNDKEYLNKLINKYWFITDDILNKDLFYPLEGYIFPDTYNIRKNSTIEEALDVFIGELGKKLEPHKQEITDSKMSVHSLLTLASMVELEAGKGEVKIGDKTYGQREAVASVFTNRLAINMKLGSDVTTFYAEQKAFQDGLTQEELDKCNAYNTRGCVKALPVGPICSPSLQAIEASIKPAETKLYYFVADKNGDLYFAETESGHINNINYLKSHDLWG